MKNLPINFIVACYLLAQPIFSLDSPLEHHTPATKSEPEVKVDLLISDVSSAEAGQGANSLGTVQRHSLKKMQPTDRDNSLVGKRVALHETKLEISPRGRFGAQVLMDPYPETTILVVGTYDRRTSRENESALFVLNRDSSMTEPVFFSVGSKYESYFINVYAIAPGEQFKVHSTQGNVAKMEPTEGPKRGKLLYRGLITPALPSTKNVKRRKKQSLHDKTVSSEQYQESLRSLYLRVFRLSEDEMRVSSSRYYHLKRRNSPDYETEIIARAREKLGISMTMTMHLSENAVLVFGAYSDDNRKYPMAYFAIDKYDNSTKTYFLRAGLEDAKYFIDLYAIKNKGFKIRSTPKGVEMLERDEVPDIGSRIYHGEVGLIISSNPL